MRLMVCLACLFINLTCFSLVPESNEDRLIPRAVLFGDPKYLTPKISYNGKYIAYLSPSHGALNVWVGKLGQIKSMHPITHNKKRGIKAFWWAYDNEHVLYIDDHKGNENWRLYQVQLKSGRTRVLFASKRSQVRIIAFSRYFPEELLIGVNSRRADFHDVYRVNLVTGKTKLIYENNSFDEFVCNDKLRIVVVRELTSNGGAVLFKIGEKFSKTAVMTIKPEDVKSTTLLGVSKTGEHLFLLDSRNRNTAGLTSFNLNTKETKLLASDPFADIDEVLFHPTEKIPQAYSATYTQQKWTVLDKNFVEDINYLNSLAPGYFNVVNRTLDDTKWIIENNRDRASPGYYYYDRSQKRAFFLFSSKPILEKMPLTKMKTVIINSRDNLQLVSYLSLPKWLQLNKYSQIPSIPLVLVVHGGPYFRDVWGYSGIHQWLANRGYAVLSVNYRGSSGFGKQFANAGNGEWGGKMQEDLIDAVEWAVSKGITSRDKVAIFGGSYGGYATLMGLAKTPEVFVCGVDIVGPSNLQTLMQSIPEYWKPFYSSLKLMIGGDPETIAGQEFLASRSPISYVNNMEKPLLIGQGANDPRVKQAESEQIVQLMTAKNIPVIYALYPDEGHGFSQPENRLSFYAIAEYFLAQHLHGRQESIKKHEISRSSVQIKAGRDSLSPFLN